MTAEILPYEPRFREDVVATVKAVYDEYGFTWEPEGYHRDLFTVEDTYLRSGGMFAVLRVDGRVAGIIAALNRGDGVAEGERLYLRKEVRGHGYGEQLLRHLVDWARDRGFDRLIGWSDKRFLEAHGLYLKIGFQRTGERVCNDPDQSPEWGFELRLR